MRHRRSNIEIFPAAWQRGLQKLAYAYIGSGVLTLVLLFVQSSLSQIDAKVIVIQRESDDALARRDLPTLKPLNDELEQQFNRMKSLAMITYGAAAMAFVMIGMLVVGTWQITVEPCEMWEKIVRFAVLLPWVLIALAFLRIQTPQTELLAFACFIFTLRGHQAALSKIARQTGNSDTATTLRMLPSYVGGLIIVMILIQSAHSAQIVPNFVAALVTWGAKIGGCVITAIFFVSICQLNWRLKQMA